MGLEAIKPKPKTAVSKGNTHKQTPKTQANWGGLQFTPAKRAHIREEMHKREILKNVMADFNGTKTAPRSLFYNSGYKEYSHLSKKGETYKDLSERYDIPVRYFQRKYGSKDEKTTLKPASKGGASFMDKIKSFMFAHSEAKPVVEIDAKLFPQFFNSKK